MKKYRCIKQFALDRYDDDGFFVPGAPMIVEEGSIFEEWSDNPWDYLIVAAPPAVHLENSDGIWIEIHPDTLALHFEEVL